MKVASISETKNRLSAIIDEVKAGEVVVVTDRGRPVARIVRIESRDEDSSGLVERLVREGIVVRGDGSMLEDPPAAVRGRGGAGVLEALLDERRGGR